ncbi:MAG: CSLREA domain-containing protein [Planctomycetes bacterium]|nr:CSLREA domain-containing protein [Planctomycetota bacterium]
MYCDKLKNFVLLVSALYGFFLFSAAGSGISVFANDSFRYEQISDFTTLQDMDAIPAIISGDGKKICYRYVDKNGKKAYLYLADANGKGSTQLIDSISAQCSGYSDLDEKSIHVKGMSYDGKKILYVTRQDQCIEETRYRVYDADSETKSEMTFSITDPRISSPKSLEPYNDNFVTLSGDGKYVFFMSYDSWDCVAAQSSPFSSWTWECSVNDDQNAAIIWRVSTDELSDPEAPGILTEIAQLEDGSTYFGFWNGDGALQTNYAGDIVAFKIENYLDMGTLYEIYICRDDGVLEKVVSTDDEHDINYFLLSHDGHWIAYQDTENAIFYTINIDDGTEYRYEMTDKDVEDPYQYELTDVSEDASWLLLNGTDHIKITDREGENTLTTRDYRYTTYGKAVWSTFGGCLSNDGTACVFVATDIENGASYPQVYVAATGIVVNTTGDESDADKSDDVIDVDLKKKGNQCTLRAAIEECNRQSGGTITFDIPTTDAGYSSTGTGTFTISPKKSLPVIKKDITIDATTQGDGIVVLSGEKAGKKTNGLKCKKGKLTVKGLTIKNFSGCGIKMQSEDDLLVEDVDVQENDDIGIVAENNILVNANKENPYSPAGREICTISNNGKGKKGGGIWSYDGYVYAHYIEITDNNGPGVFAGKGTTLSSIKANRNKGPGLQAMQYGITINPATEDYSEENEVSDNEGPGILAGIDVVMTYESEGDLTDAVANDIEIKTHINVQNNAGWGIFCEKGWVSLNKSTGSGYTTVVSLITKNGDKEKDCYIVDENGDLVLLTDYDVGGIAANGSYFEGTHLDISDNNGPGIVAKTGMTLASIKANNNKGPGIQSMLGGVEIEQGASDYSEENQVNNNEGPGILAGTDVIFDATTESGGENYSVGIRSHIKAENNGGWGIFCQKGYVEINVASGMLTALSDSISSVSGNGDSSLPCYIVSSEGDLTELTDYDVGGIGASAGGLTAANLDVSNNTGVGIEAGGDVVIGTGTVCGNTGGDIVSDGVQSLTDVISGENCN